MLRVVHIFEGGSQNELQRKETVKRRIYYCGNHQKLKDCGIGSETVLIVWQLGLTFQQKRLNQILLSGTHCSQRSQYHCLFGRRCHVYRAQVFLMTAETLLTACSHYWQLLQATDPAA